MTQTTPPSWLMFIDHRNRAAHNNQTDSWPLTPRERLLWLLRHECHLSVSRIMALRWRDLADAPTADAIVTPATLAYRQSLGAKTFLLHPDAPVFTSRNRGRGGQQVAINRWQLNHLLRQAKRKMEARQSHG